MARFYQDSNRLLSVVGNRLISKYGSDGLGVLSLISSQCAVSLTGGWCSATEIEGIGEILRIDHARILEIVQFLAAHGFVVIDEEGKVADPFVLEDREQLERKRDTFRRNRGYPSRSSNSNNNSDSDLNIPYSSPHTETLSTQTSTQTNATSTQTSLEHEQEQEQENEVEKEPENEPGGVRGGCKPPDPPAGGGSWLGIAEEKLKKPTPDAGWTAKNAWITAGRRPMEDYPDVWLTTRELAGICEDYDASGVPPKDFKVAFRRAQAQADTIKSRGEDPSNKGAAGWLLGFIKRDILESSIKETRLQTAKEGARRVA